MQLACRINLSGDSPLGRTAARQREHRRFTVTRKTVTATCEYCQESFQARVDLIARGDGRYHSRICARRARCKDKVEKRCFNCGIGFMVIVSVSERGWGRYCSLSCRDEDKRIPLEERFWSKVIKGGADECWNWTANTNIHGYGSFCKVSGESPVGAHRVSWELTNGSIVDDQCVLHRCDNRLCVNPSHLFLGSHQDNSTDMVQKGRSVFGTKNPQAKLTEKNVAEILGLRGIIGQRSLAKKFNVSKNAIKLILDRKTWRHVAEEPVCQ